MITIKDISVECGVSISTVSKALNGYGDISQATKDLILKKASEMGYFPNSNARALKTNKTYSIGVLFIDLVNNALKNEYFSHVLASFKLEAEKRGYDITFINRNIGHQKLSFLEHCRYRSFDGICIGCVDFSDTEVIELINSNLPIVTVDHIFGNTISILSANQDGMEKLVRYIYAQGHRKIAYIHGTQSFVTHNRLVSFHTTMNNLGLQVHPEYLQKAYYHDPVSTGEAVRRLLALKDRPTCIIMPDDYAALGGLTSIEEAGLRVPEDISIAGYDGISISQVINPKLTTIKQDTEKIGYEAAKKLIQLIENPYATSLENIVLDVELIEGSSVKNLNA